MDPTKERQAAKAFDHLLSRVNISGQNQMIHHQRRGAFVFFGAINYS
ncbi:hypothetical protein CCACVL1_26101 [Corchorus capsularis]|uniref:Uncharacterized protein n=1 Tax=Corchorus capsularis TaxID=210143 RepID=A0A1R3GFW8_COCAP|nr:hypothetical protein CCACVL1_26101 [Corchorus capsularis]